MIAGCSERMRRGSLRLLGVLALGTATSWATVVIDKCVLVDLDQGTEKPGGPGQMGRNFKFRAAARCTCCCATISYEWDFGDGSTGVGQEVLHPYSGGGGNAVGVEATCTGCQSSATGGTVLAHVISGIEITKVGNDTKPLNPPLRLCFNSVTGVEANVLPTELSWAADQLIDWKLTVGTYDIIKTNDWAPDMDLPVANWPWSNTAWGIAGGPLKACIDDPDIPGQDDELVTGAASILVCTAVGGRFFEKWGEQSPASAGIPNWYYYWAGDKGGPCEHRYAATSTYEGAVITWEYDGNLGKMGFTDVGSGNATITLGSAAAGAVNRNWYSYSITFDDSSDVERTYPVENTKFYYVRQAHEGIDVAEYVAWHEKGHVLTYRNWKSGGPWLGEADEDEDCIPDCVEDTEEQGTRWDVWLTFPFYETGWGDQEVFCEDQAIGDHPNEGPCISPGADWAHPGKQWP